MKIVFSFPDISHFLNSSKIRSQARKWRAEQEKKLDREREKVLQTTSLVSDNIGAKLLALAPLLVYITFSVVLKHYNLLVQESFSGC